ncbi:MAG: arylsulfatase [Sphaerochaeta sp.]|nr:arylsulfatase [Sphaerochaeta sp.]
MRPHDPGKRPNFVVIVADDLGFSDLGCYGSEIRTPNIDRIADEGVKFTQMYTCARCCPSRASIFTGLYPHQAGMGHMVADLEHPSYRGFIGDNTMTMAEVLKESGYRTALTGKWHVGGFYEVGSPETWRPGTIGYPTPLSRGFEEFYGTLEGLGSFYNPHTLMDGETPISVCDDDFYYTHEITKRSIDFIKRFGEKDDPFYISINYTAPHWPLHALPEDIARYEQTYRKGWDATRTARHETMRMKGVVNPKWGISSRDTEVPPWEDVEFKDWEAMRMAVYAAQIDAMDQGIGKILAELDRQGIADDTLILFLSDNGASAEFLAENGKEQSLVYPMRDGNMPLLGNIPALMPGGEDTYQSYGRAWANVSNTPFRMFKHWVHEGGIASPCVARFPKLGNLKGKCVDTPLHLIDIAPTCYNLARSKYPKEYNGHAITPLAGEDFSRLFSDSPWTRQQPIFFEHEGNAAIRNGQWKLVRSYNSPWELYDLEADRPELMNIKGKNGKLVRMLEGEYLGWEEHNQVLPWDTVRTMLKRFSWA